MFGAPHPAWTDWEEVRGLIREAYRQVTLTGTLEALES
jgi:hypothetical protein